MNNNQVFYPYGKSDKIHDTAEGLVGGAVASISNLANIISPKSIGGFTDPQGIMANIGYSANPIAIAAGVATGGLSTIPLVTTAISMGSFGGASYITDYLSQKASDSNYEFSIGNMLKDAGLSAIGGVALHGLGMGISKVYSAFKHTDVADELMAGTHVTNATNDMKNGTINGTDLNQMSKPDIKVKPDAPIIDYTKATNNYKTSLPVKELADQLLEINDARRLLDEHGSVEKISQDYDRQTRTENEYMTKSITDTWNNQPELKEFMMDDSNGRELFKALRGQSEDDVANGVAKTIDGLQDYVIDNVNKYVPMSKLQGWFGRQQWDADAIRKLFTTDDGTQTFVDMLNKADTTVGRDAVAIDINNVKDIFQPIINKDVGSFNLSNKGIKERQINMGNGDGAYDVYSNFMIAKPLIQTLRETISDGASRITHSRMFGDNYSGIYKQLNRLNEYHFTDPKTRPNINVLNDAVNKGAITSSIEQQTMIDAINTPFAIARALKTVTQPLWQSVFVPADILANATTTYAKYGIKSFDNITKSMPDIQNYLHQLKPQELTSWRDTITMAKKILKDDSLRWFEKVKNTAMLIDNSANGNHMADTMVRKTAFLLRSHGIKAELQNELNSEILNIATKNGENYMPDAQLLKDMATKLNKEKVIPLRNSIAEAKELGLSKSDIKPLELEMVPHVAKVQELDKAGALINSKIEKALNETNPLTYNFGKDTKKGSIASIMPIRMARWVINTWTNTNLAMMKGAYYGIKEGNLSKATRNLSALAIYGTGLGLIDTMMNAMYTGKAPETEDYVKNISMGMFAGSMYLVGMNNPLTSNPIFKLGKEEYNEQVKGKDPQYHKAFGIYGAILNLINSDGEFKR